MQQARWETNTRWYEVLMLKDLFDCYTVVRLWGGKGNHRHGQMIEPFSDEAQAKKRIEEIARQRSRRKPPYVRVE